MNLSPLHSVADRRCVRTLAFALSALCATLLPAQAQVQQSPVPEQPSVAPQIEIAGTGIATLDVGRGHQTLPNGTRQSSSGFNVSDSDLLFSASERLYHGGIGSVTAGAITTDNGNTGVSNGAGTQVFLNQAFLDYQTLHSEAYLGRTDNPTNQVVAFPTLRGDDLVTFTNILDPFSNGENIEEHRYSNVGAVVLNQHLNTFENIHVQHLIDSSGAGGTGSTGLNSYGFTVQHLSPPGLEELERVVSYGGGVEYRSIPGSLGGRSTALYAGGVINLEPGLSRRLDLRLQDVYTFGNTTNTFANLSDSYRADSNTLTGAIRLLRSPFGKPGSQLSLTGGYRTYQKLSAASSYGVALTGVKRLGEGFDFVAQLMYTHRSPALAAVYGGASSERALQLGLSYNFDTTLDRNIGPRRSLTNLQHQYVPN